MYVHLSGEKLGRKKTFITGVIIMSIGAILQTCAFSVQQMIVARLITGVYIRFSSVIWTWTLTGLGNGLVPPFSFFIFHLFTSQSHALISEVSTRLLRQCGKAKLPNLHGEEDWLYLNWCMKPIRNIPSFLKHWLNVVLVWISLDFLSVTGWPMDSALNKGVLPGDSRLPSSYFSLLSYFRLYLGYQRVLGGYSLMDIQKRALTY